MFDLLQMNSYCLGKEKHKGVFVGGCVFLRTHKNASNCFKMLLTLPM